MNRVRLVQRRILFLAVAAMCFLPCTVNATTVHFVATDLSDATPGEDLWRYDYTVGGQTFSQGQFFDVLFDPLLYGALTAGPSPSSDWDVAVLQQPNPVNLPPFDRGIFDAFALVNDPSINGTFSLNFVYLGGGSPGSQPFQIYGSDAELLESGFTTPAGTVVPEPSSLLMFAFAILAVAGFRLPRALVSRP
jgi:hypothetical protein